MWFADLLHFLQCHTAHANSLVWGKQGMFAQPPSPHPFCSLLCTMRLVSVPRWLSFLQKLRSKNQNQHRCQKKRSLFRHTSSCQLYQPCHASSAVWPSLQASPTHINQTRHQPNQSHLKALLLHKHPLHQGSCRSNSNKWNASWSRACPVTCLTSL